MVYHAFPIWHFGTWGLIRRIVVLVVIAVVLFSARGWWPGNRPPGGKWGGPGGPSPA